MVQGASVIAPNAWKRPLYTNTSQNENLPRHVAKDAVRKCGGRNAPLQAIIELLPPNFRDKESEQSLRDQINRWPEDFIYDAHRDLVSLREQIQENLEDSCVRLYKSGSIDACGMGSNKNGPGRLCEGSEQIFRPWPFGTSKKTDLERCSSAKNDWSTLRPKINKGFPNIQGDNYNSRQRTGSEIGRVKWKFDDVFYAPKSLQIAKTRELAAAIQRYKPRPVSPADTASDCENDWSSSIDKDSSPKTANPTSVSENSRSVECNQTEDEPSDTQSRHNRRASTGSYVSALTDSNDTTHSKAIIYPDDDITFGPRLTQLGAWVSWRRVKRRLGPLCAFLQQRPELFDLQQQGTAPLRAKLTDQAQSWLRCEDKEFSSAAVRKAPPETLDFDAWQQLARSVRGNDSNTTTVKPNGTSEPKETNGETADLGKSETIPRNSVSQVNNEVKAQDAGSIPNWGNVPSGHSHSDPCLRVLVCSTLSADWPNKQKIAWVDAALALWKLLRNDTCPKDLQNVSDALQWDTQYHEQTKVSLEQFCLRLAHLFMLATTKNYSVQTGQVPSPSSTISIQPNPRALEIISHFKNVNVHSQGKATDIYRPVINNQLYETWIERIAYANENLPKRWIRHLLCNTLHRIVALSGNENGSIARKIPFHQLESYVNFNQRWSRATGYTSLREAIMSHSYLIQLLPAMAPQGFEQTNQVQAYFCPCDKIASDPRQFQHIRLARRQFVTSCIVDVLVAHGVGGNVPGNTFKHSSSKDNAVRITRSVAYNILENALRWDCLFAQDFGSFKSFAFDQIGTLSQLDFGFDADGVFLKVNENVFALSPYDNTAEPKLSRDVKANIALGNGLLSQGTSSFYQVAQLSNGGKSVESNVNNGANPQLNQTYRMFELLPNTQVSAQALSTLDSSPSSFENISTDSGISQIPQSFTDSETAQSPSKSSWPTSAQIDMKSQSEAANASKEPGLTSTSPELDCKMMLPQMRDFGLGHMHILPTTSLFHEQNSLNKFNNRSITSDLMFPGVQRTPTPSPQHSSNSQGKWMNIAAPHSSSAIQTALDDLAQIDITSPQPMSTGDGDVIRPMSTIEACLNDWSQRNEHFNNLPAQIALDVVLHWEKSETKLTENAKPTECMQILVSPLQYPIDVYETIINTAHLSPKHLNLNLALILSRTGAQLSQSVDLASQDVRHGDKIIVNL